MSLFPYSSLFSFSSLLLFCILTQLPLCLLLKVRICFVTFTTGMHIYVHTHKHSVVTISCSSLVEMMCMYYYFSEGSNLTPAHHCSDFRFKTYAPVAFRYFRDLFGIQPEDFMVSPASLSPALCCLFLIPHFSSFTIQPLVACAQCCQQFPSPAILSDHSCFT